MISRAARHIREHLHLNTAIPRCEVPEWLERYDVRAGVTTGHGAHDFVISDSGTAVDLWRALAAELGGFHATAVSRQPHGVEVGIHSDLPTGLTVLHGLDGHVTTRANVLLAVTVADCVPVYLVEPSSGTIGILHAGWRGTAAGILEAGIRTMMDVARARGDEIVMHCGISICGSCYEVGPEVVEAVLGVRPEGPEPLDLRAALLDRAFQLGLRRISVSDCCTAHEPGAFHSHRASGSAAGRMAAYIGRPLG